MVHGEPHRSQRGGWLRAGVLGANDGIVSTAALILGVAAADASAETILLSGTAAMVAGAMSMAAGEYVSVSSQADAEKADIEREKYELANFPDAEKRELAGIYRRRGLDAALAAQVAEQLTAHDALGAHARDELGLSRARAARPLQAASTSASAFATGGSVPLAVTWLIQDGPTVPVVAGACLLLLALLGYVAARIGGARPWRAMLRVMFWGALAMLLTSAVGSLFGI